MKALLILFFAASFYYPCQKEVAITAKPKHPVKVDTINFTTQLQPIFVTRCSPCHFPGGKMYERLPFDKAETILGHQEGILRRIKDEKENSLIRQYIEQRKVK